MQKLRKPYLCNDLNSITQLRSIEEGTPSAEKTMLTASQGKIPANFVNIEEEIEKELQLKGFDDMMRDRDNNAYV